MFSPDGQLLVTGGKDGRIQVFIAHSLRLVREMRGHGSPVQSIALYGDLAASASADQLIRLWNYRSGQESRTLGGHLSAVNAVAFSPDGTLLASASMLALLTETAAGKLGKSPLELFFNEFFYPSLLKTILDGETPPVATELTAVDRRQPQIRVSLAEEIPAPVTAQLSIQVNEAAPDSARVMGSIARYLCLFRNGVLVKTWPGEVIRPGAATLKVNAELALVPGTNTFTAYDFNSANVKSGDASLKVTASERIQPDAVLHLVMIGISRYANPEFNLNYAVKDADAVSAGLPELSGGRFTSVQPIRLNDPDPTKQNILLALKILAGRTAEQRPPALAWLRPAGPQDSVLIYYAGHGTAYCNHFYLIPHDLSCCFPAASRIWRWRKRCSHWMAAGWR